MKTLRIVTTVNNVFDQSVNNDFSMENYMVRVRSDQFAGAQTPEVTFYVPYHAIASIMLLDAQPDLFVRGETRQ